MKPIIIIQGAQFGSEAKGAITAAICKERGVDYAVRTGTVNAGHTVYYKGMPFKMQQLPTAWVNWAERPADAILDRIFPKLVIGPGAYIHPEILARELQIIHQQTGIDPWSHTYIDYRCGLHLPHHTTLASEAGRHHKMGATGKGCSEAVVAKIKYRGVADGILFKTWLESDKGQIAIGYMGTPNSPLNRYLFNLQFCDTAELLNKELDANATVLIEGTQGTMLDLHLGPYPYTTHKQTQVGNWMAEAGLSPSLPTEIILVARTYPIRVAGNSGPMKNEIGWPKLARRINRKLIQANLKPRVAVESIQSFEDACRIVAAKWIAMSNLHPSELDSPFGDNCWQIETWSQAQRERNPKFVSELHREALDSLSEEIQQDLYRVFETTTVTAKLRRLANLDYDQLRYSVMINRPASIALTFVNYVIPEIWDKQDWDFSEEAKMALDNLIDLVENQTGCPVHYISTGAATECVLPMRIDIARLAREQG